MVIKTIGANYPIWVLTPIIDKSNSNFDFMGRFFVSLKWNLGGTLINSIISQDIFISNFTKNTLEV